MSKQYLKEVNAKMEGLQKSYNTLMPKIKEQEMMLETYQLEQQILQDQVSHEIDLVTKTFGHTKEFIEKNRTARLQQMHVFVGNLEDKQMNSTEWEQFLLMTKNAQNAQQEAAYKFVPKSNQQPPSQ